MNKKADGFLKQILIGVIVLLIVYFLVFGFSNSLTSAYDKVENGVKNVKAEQQTGQTQITPEITKLVKQDDCFTFSLYDKSIQGDIKKAVCQFDCYNNNQVYYSNKCEGRDLICYCESPE